MEAKLNILYYIKLFKKYRKKILFLIALAVTVALIISFFKPPVYTSRCSILLSETTAGPSLSNLTESIGFPGFSLHSFSGKMIIALVKSRRMMEDIYSNFQELEKKDGFELEVYDTTQNTLIIQVKGRNPKLVSDIANFCAENLNKINIELEISSQVPLVKVLDSAIPPTKPDSRQVLKYITMAAVLAFFVGNLFFFSQEYYKTLITKENEG